VNLYNPALVLEFMLVIINLFLLNLAIQQTEALQQSLHLNGNNFASNSLQMLYLNSLMEINIFMRTFFAIQQHKTINAGWQQCLRWARQQILEQDAPVHLLTARGGDKDAVIIVEITLEHERMIDAFLLASNESVQ